MILLSGGSKPAFELLYDRYFEKLVWYISDFTKERTIAEDIVQETFIKLIDAPDKFDATRKFSTWIYTLAANLARNYIRDKKLFLQKQQQHQLHNIDLIVNQQHQMDANLLSRRINELISGLSGKERSIYELRFGQQMSIKDISLQMNIPEGSVKSGIYYLLKKFSIHLNYQHHEN